MIKICFKINGCKYELNWIAVHGFFYRLRTKFKSGGFIQKKIDIFIMKKLLREHLLGNLRVVKG